jgi:hypothetical protein
MTEKSVPPNIPSDEDGDELNDATQALSAKADAGQAAKEGEEQPKMPNREHLIGGVLKEDAVTPEHIQATAESIVAAFKALDAKYKPIREAAARKKAEEEQNAKQGQKNSE